MSQGFEACGARVFRTEGQIFPSFKRQIKIGEKLVDIKYIKRFSKHEIIEELMKEREKTQLLLEILDAHKLIIKQASQRLDMSKYLEVR